jgi:hypothetical protein
MSDEELTVEESLERELIGVQEMLAHVLATVGTPVEVAKESLQDGLPAGTEIQVDDTPDAFVFSLKLPE